MRLLELFCGTKSVGTEFENAGYEVVSLDYNPSFKATHTVDILNWDYRQYPPDFFDVIWGSPDCVTWSVATGGKYRLKSSIYGLDNSFQPQATTANNMVLRVIEILKYFTCKAWFIENPRGNLIHFPPLQQFIKDISGHTTLVYYGNYNWSFPKPTYIWSNLFLWKNETMPVMSEDTYVVRHRNDGRVDKYYKAYGDVKSKDRSRIPPDLIKRLMSLILL